MKRSPFPGMDPYLETHWPDVHSSLVIDARNALNARLPDDLAASSEERVAVESDEEPDHRYHPDVRLFEMPADDSAVAIATAPSKRSAIAPFRLFAQVDPVMERSIRIVQMGTERLITVIEFVSPTNKRNPDMYDFRAKRAELLTAGVNFVEIDLVRAGVWRALLRPYRCRPEQETIYRATVRLPSDPGALGLYPIPIREPLPSIVIPLRDKDPEVRLELQPLIEQAYTNGRYARRLHYQTPLDPPLDADDAEWAKALVSS
jgi:hypothetical protein